MISFFQMFGDESEPVTLTEPKEKKPEVGFECFRTEPVCPLRAMQAIRDMCRGGTMPGGTK
jgi:hypothetical protein